MRAPILFAVLGLLGQAHASFDLVLVADNTGSFTGPITSKVHRYDGDSGVYLGAFETGFNAISDMAVDYSANEVFVANAGFVGVYNIGTGALKRNFNPGTNTGALKMVNGTLYRSSGNSLYSVNKTNGTQTLVKNWTTAITDFAFAANGAYLLYNSAATSLVGFTSGGVMGTAFGSVTIGGGNGHLAFDGSSPNSFYLMGDQNASTTTQIHYGSLSNTGTFSAGSASYTTALFNSFVDIAPSHTGYYMYGKNNAGAKALYRMHFGLGSGDRMILTPQITAPGQIAVVLAPEPGTCIAVGVGVAALLKRRKNKR